jgi:hypothetical protein
MRSLIKRARGVEGIMKMERKQADQKKILLYGIMILLLLVFQEVLGKVGESSPIYSPTRGLIPIKPLHGFLFTISLKC